MVGSQAVACGCGFDSHPREGLDGHTGSRPVHPETNGKVAPKGEWTQRSVPSGQLEDYKASMLAL